jgi:hypothetical protein
MIGCSQEGTMVASVSLLGDLCLGNLFPLATNLSPEPDWSAGEYPLVTGKGNGGLSKELLFQGPLSYHTNETVSLRMQSGHH